MTKAEVPEQSQNKRVLAQELQEALMATRSMFVALLALGITLAQSRAQTSKASLSADETIDNDGEKKSNELKSLISSQPVDETEEIESLKAIFIPCPPTGFII